MVTLYTGVVVHIPGHCSPWGSICFEAAAIARELFQILVLTLITSSGMAVTSKVPEHTMHVEEHPHISMAVPEGVKVDGGLLLDAGDKNELHLKVAKDGRVRSRVLCCFSPIY